jgi:hypothetical protein
MRDEEADGKCREKNAAEPLMAAANQVNGSP